MCNTIESFKSSIAIEHHHDFTNQLVSICLVSMLGDKEASASASTPPSTSNTVETCTCDLCKKGNIPVEVNQHMIVQHFVSTLKLKSDDEWCMSSDIIHILETFMDKVADSCTLKINKNNISQDLATFLTKKRRVCGMTFNCRLPKQSEIDCLIKTTTGLVFTSACRS